MASEDSTLTITLGPITTAECGEGSQSEVLLSALACHRRGVASRSLRRLIFLDEVTWRKEAFRRKPKSTEEPTRLLSDYHTICVVRGFVQSPHVAEILRLNLFSLGAHKTRRSRWVRSLVY